MLSAGLGGAGTYTRGESSRGVLSGGFTLDTLDSAGQSDICTLDGTLDGPWTAPVTGTRQAHSPARVPRCVHRYAAVWSAAARSAPLGGICAGPGRGVGREALSRCGFVGFGAGSGVRGRFRGLGVPGSRASGCLGVGGALTLCGPVAKQGRDRGGRAGRAGRVGRAGNRAETGVAERSAVLPCCRAAVLPELPRARAAACPRVPALAEVFRSYH